MKGPTQRPTKMEYREAVAKASTVTQAWERLVDAGHEVTEAQVKQTLDEMVAMKMAFIGEDGRYRAQP